MQAILWDLKVFSLVLTWLQVNFLEHDLVPAQDTKI